jgi:hypothetical protein
MSMFSAFQQNGVIGNRDRSVTGVTTPNVKNRTLSSSELSSFRSQIANLLKTLQAVLLLRVRLPFEANLVARLSRAYEPVILSAPLVSFQGCS